MKRILGLGFVFILGLSFAGGLRADEPKDIIAKAIKAGGGEEKLAKFKAQTWSAKGTYYGMGAEIPYTAEYAAKWPNKFRVEIKDFMTIVFNSDKGWRKMAGGDANEMTADELAEQKEAHHSAYVATLLPLKDNAYTLASLGEVKVGDRPAVGVKVSAKGHRDVNLYFDKETNLLAKSEYTVKAQEDGGKEVPQESLVSDYRDVDGAKVAMKMTINRDGKKYIEAETTQLKAADKLDDSMFDKP